MQHAGKGNAGQVENRCEHGSFESLCADLWSIAFSALSRLPRELFHSMCARGTINSLGKFGFSDHLIVCIVCSVSASDSVLAGHALPWLCALGLSLTEGKVGLPRERWSPLLGRNIQAGCRAVSLMETGGRASLKRDPTAQETSWRLPRGAESGCRAWSQSWWE